MPAFDTDDGRPSIGVWPQGLNREGGFAIFKQKVSRALRNAGARREADFGESRREALCRLGRQLAHAGRDAAVGRRRSLRWRGRRLLCAPARCDRTQHHGAQHACNDTKLFGCQHGSPQRPCGARLSILRSRAVRGKPVVSPLDADPDGPSSFGLLAEADARADKEVVRRRGLVAEADAGFAAKGRDAAAEALLASLQRQRH